MTTINVIYEGSRPKKRVYLGKFSQMCEPTHPPRVIVRFGKTKGEIRVEKGDFWGILRGLDLVWELATHPHLGEISPQKKFFLGPSLIDLY